MRASEKKQQALKSGCHESGLNLQDTAGDITFLMEISTEYGLRSAELKPFKKQHERS